MLCDSLHASFLTQSRLITMLVYASLIAHRWIQGDTSEVVLIVLCFGIKLLCYLRCMCVFLFSVKFG